MFKMNITPNLDELDKTTVIIINYNYSDYVSQAVESVINQTQKVKQIIIVDDCSTDVSKKKIDFLNKKYPYIKVIYNKENLGINGVLNSIIPKIKTKYLLMLDADDWLDLGFYEKMINHMKLKEDNLDFIYSNCILVDENGENVGIGYSNAFDKELILEKSYIPRPALVKTEILSKALPLDTSLANGAKHNMWKKIVLRGGIGEHIPEHLFYYRMHSRNISGIGKRILQKDKNQKTEAILSGFWKAI